MQSFIKFSLVTLILAGTATPNLVFAQHDASHDHGHHAVHQSSSPTQQPKEAGQAAFAAIQEIVAILRANPETDWTQVNIDALREHLVDMHLVTLYALVSKSTLENGSSYQVTGDGATVGAIQRMVTAHARQVSADTDWTASTRQLPNGVELTITAQRDSDIAMINGLGFSGFMALGDHHQPHHLMMATGAFHHAH